MNNFYFKNKTKRKENFRYLTKILNMLLWSSEKTHIMVLRDWREFKITTEQYNKISELKQSEKASYPIRVIDSYKNKVLFHWEIWKIAEFKEINKAKDTDYYYTCHYCWRINRINYWKCECDNELKNKNFDFEEAKKRAFKNWWQELLKKVSNYWEILDKAQKWNYHNVTKEQINQLPF
jgi:hypothetical protein